MLKETMEALIDIAYFHASPFDTFIWMYNVSKPPHVLPKFSMDKLVMQEVSYHILVGLLARLHQRKKAPCPTPILWIELYEIQNIKHVARVQEIYFRHQKLQFVCPTFLCEGSLCESLIFVDPRGVSLG